jgi:hypothetical protein
VLPIVFRKIFFEKTVGYYILLTYQLRNSCSLSEIDEQQCKLYYKMVPIRARSHCFWKWDKEIRAIDSLLLKFENLWLKNGGYNSRNKLVILKKDLS